MASEYPLKETWRAIRQAGWGGLGRNWRAAGFKALQQLQKETTVHKEAENRHIRLSVLKKIH